MATSSPSPIDDEWICADGVDLNEAREFVSTREGHSPLVMAWPVVAYIQSADWVPSGAVYPGGRYPAEIGRLHRFRISSAPAFADVVRDRLRRRLRADLPDRAPAEPTDRPVHASGEEMNAALVRYLACRPDAIGWPLSAEIRERESHQRWGLSSAVRFGSQLAATDGYSYRFRAADSPGFYEALGDYRNARRAEAVRVGEPFPADVPAAAAVVFSNGTQPTGYFVMGAPDFGMHALAPTPTPRPDPQDVREQGPSAVAQVRGIVRKVLTVLPDDFSGDEFPDDPPSRGIVGGRPAEPSPTAEWIDLAEEV